MSSKAVRKHRELSASSSWKAGFSEPSFKKSKAKDYPHKQAFVPKDKNK